MEARVLVNMPFLGKDRKAGEVISSDDWMQTTQQVRDTLISGKYVTLDTGEGDGQMSSAELKLLDGRILRLESSLEGIHRKLDSLLDKKPKAKAKGEK